MEKILIANRGEIAVRIIRTIRDLDYKSVSIYDQNDWQSSHVRISDECYAIQSELNKANDLEIIELAKRIKVDAIHPGYGFLAEKADFAQSCVDAGINFIGPPPEILELLQDRHRVLSKLDQAGIPVPRFSDQNFEVGRTNEIIDSCGSIGYPLIFQARFHQPGRSIWFIENQSQAYEMLERLHQKQPSFEIFIEEKITPAHLVRVPFICMRNAKTIVFNEVDSSIQFRNRRLIEESPSPIITTQQRQVINQISQNVVHYLNYSGLGTIDYLVDDGGHVFFSKIKPYLPASHVLNELVTGLDLVGLQIKYAAGLDPDLQLDDIQVNDSSLLCRISAVDPYKNFLPSPGVVRNLRLPAGPFVRCDSHITNGYHIPEIYDPILAKISVSGKDRQSALSRMHRALSETTISGITTDLPVLLYILDQQELIAGQYHTEFLNKRLEGHLEAIYDHPSEDEYKNFVFAAATAYTYQRKFFRPIVPDRLKSSWHQDSRKP
jgi:acetyl-CoA carboxylase, biotin carboxylase subunit